MALTPWRQWLLQTMIHREFAVARMQSMLYITLAKGLLLGCKWQTYMGRSVKVHHDMQGIVGRIIGRGGETIRALQQASQAHIVVDQNYPEGQPRRVNISGRQDAVDRAAKMVQELISGEPGSAQSIIQKVLLGPLYAMFTWIYLMFVSDVQDIRNSYELTKAKAEVLEWRFPLIICS